MNNPFAALASFARGAANARTAMAQCELCGAAIGATHAHVVELLRRAEPGSTETPLKCACTACAVLFRERGAGNGRFRTVPERVLVDETFAPSEAAWTALGVPVRLAFLVRHGDETWTAHFPSPGGAVAADLTAEAAATLAATTSLAQTIEPEIEALLLHRPRGRAAECMLVPLDVGHELTAIVRRNWRGFSGGDDVERALDEYFEALRARARGAAR